MQKYRIKLHPEGYYTIQKRVWLFFWEEIWFWVADRGLDELLRRNIYRSTPTDILEHYNKYG